MSPARQPRTPSSPTSAESDTRPPHAPWLNAPIYHAYFGGSGSRAARRSMLARYRAHSQPRTCARTHEADSSTTKIARRAFSAMQRANIRQAHSTLLAEFRSSGSRTGRVPFVARARKLSTWTMFADGTLAKSDAYCHDALFTAATTSSGPGNRQPDFSSTRLPSTHTENSPDPPISSAASTPSSRFSSAAARAALGRYPQELQ